MTASLRRIGVLTGGGDCPGLNAVIRAVVKTAESYGLEVTGVQDGFHGLIFGPAHPLTSQDVTGILPRGGTILGTSNRDNPLDYTWEENGELRHRDMTDQCAANLKNWGVDAVVFIGGDGSLTVSQGLAKKGVLSVGVPKTIDNDLGATDQTFGFDTALAVATDALDRLHTTAESHHRCMVLEVMGRNAGWIALESGLAGGADVILVPEIPFDMEHVAAKVRSRVAEGKKFSIVVVAEGAAPRGGKQVVQRVIATSAEPIRLGGVGNQIGQQIEDMTDVETRVTVLGHIQRGGSPTPYDRILATRYGVHAVELLVAGQFGRMVALKGTEITSVPISEALNNLRRVDPDGDMVRTARSLGISFGDRT